MNTIRKSNVSNHECQRTGGCDLAPTVRVTVGAAAPMDYCAICAADELAAVADLVHSLGHSYSVKVDPLADPR